MTAGRLAPLDVFEALQLAYAVTALEDLGVFGALGKPRTAHRLAAQFGLNAPMLAGVLHFVAGRTTLLRAGGRGHFVLTPDYSPHARFLMNLYGGAFRSSAEKLAHSLKSGARFAARAIDRGKHARAFESADSRGAVLASVVRQLDLNHVLDLGCGTGAMLLDLAQRDRGFRGVGMEQNPAMCRAARASLRKEGVASRVKILRGDVSQAAKFLTASARKQVAAIVASQVANEMFGSGDRGVVRWLRGLRRAFSGRLMLIADYYGRLGTGIATQRETLLHDYVQVISGQGVPPATTAQWRGLYEAAGVRLVHVLHDKTTTLFIHVIML